MPGAVAGGIALAPVAFGDGKGYTSRQILASGAVPNEV